MITVGFFLVLILMSIVAFFQNMAFTAVSRSRNSGDPNYHRYCAWGSNGIWFACQMFIWSQIMPILMTPITAWTFLGTVKLLITMVVYTLSTTEGSVYMMKILLKKEKGKRQVGGNAIEELKKDLTHFKGFVNNSLDSALYDRQSACEDLQQQMKYITNRLDDLEGS